MTTMLASKTFMRAYRKECAAIDAETMLLASNPNVNWRKLKRVRKRAEKKTR